MQVNSLEVEKDPHHAVPESAPFQGESMQVNASSESAGVYSSNIQFHFMHAHNYKC